jgi:DNA-binding MarR family transcriptional regulator
MTRREPAGSEGAVPAAHGSSGDSPELVEGLITASRALVGVAVRSIAAAPVDLTMPQHRALVLIGSGRTAGVTALAEGMGVNQSNASRLVDRLQRLGLVGRRRSTADARAAVITLTPAGREALDAVTDRRRDDIAAIVRAMNAADAAEAVRVMRAFNDAASEVADDAWPT